MNISNILKSVNWIRAKDHYVIVDPMNSSGLLYLNESKYQKMVAVSLSNGTELVVISTPDESRESVYSKFDVKSDGSTPPINDLRAKFSSMFTIRAGWIVKDSMIRFKRNFKSFLPTYYRDIRSWLGLKNPLFAFSDIKSMSLTLDRMRRLSNINFVILYMKVASIAMLQYIAGNPLSSTQTLGKRIKLTNGLPSIIPKSLRSRIRKGDKTTIIVVSSLLHAFKGFIGENPKPSLGSIEAPHMHNTFSLSTWRLRRDSRSFVSNRENNFEKDWFNDYDPTDFTRPTPAERLKWDDIKNEILKSNSRQKRQEFDSNIAAFWKFFNTKRIEPNLLYAFPPLKLILTAGPSNANSILGSHIDAMLIVRNRETRELFEDFITQANEVQEYKYNRSRVSEDADLLAHIETVGNSLYTKLLLNPLYDDLWKEINMRASKVGFKYDHSISKKENLDRIIQVLPRGKLAFKQEAAGKVRIFALGDYWSQMLMSPLHDSVSKLLRNHPCDATFDQLGKVKEFTERRYRFIASYDLKSATDLIPIHLYEDTLSFWTSRAFASVALEILVSRGYVVPEDPHLDRKTVFYTRGQPMGILSSWVLLALVHHYLVFLSAQRAKEVNFQDYLVLGDDIAIAHPAVSEHYKAICSEYGITIGLPKSFVSNLGFFQFASQNIFDGDNVSPISLKEVLMVSSNALYFGPSTALSAKVEWLHRLRGRGFIRETISDSLRAISTYSEWRRMKSSLTKGVIPSERLNAIVSILVSDLAKAPNTFHLDQFLAAMKGEYGIFTGKFSEDPKLRYQYLEEIYKYLKLSLVSILVKAKKASHNELYDSYGLRVKAVRELLPEVKYAVEPAINEIVDSHALKFAEIFNEWRQLEAKFDEKLSLEYWDPMRPHIKDEIEFNFEEIAKALSLVEKARSLVLEKTLMTGAINKVKNIPRLTILHKQLLNRISAVTIAGKG